MKQGLNSLIAIVMAFLSFSNLAQASEKFFMIAHAGTGDPFWNVEFNGAKMAAAQAGIDLQILAPETPNDIARQVELLNAAIAAKPSGIALSIPDENAFSFSLREARRRGIKLVAFNAEPRGKNNKLAYEAFIGMDEYLAGIRAGERALASGRVQKRAMVAIHQAGHIGLEQRFRGIKEVLAKKNIKVDKLDVGSDASQALEIMRGYLNANPDASAIFCVGPPTLHVIGKFVQREKRKIYLASFDLTPLTLRFIEKGILDFSIDQQPFMQGYMAISQLVLASKAKIRMASIDTGSSVIDKSNLGQIKELVRKGIR